MSNITIEQRLISLQQALSQMMRNTSERQIMDELTTYRIAIQTTLKILTKKQKQTPSLSASEYDVIRFGNITMDGRDGDPIIKYNFKIVSSPDPDLNNKDPIFQNYVGDVLFIIMKKGMEDGTLQSREIKE